MANWLNVGRQIAVVTCVAAIFAACASTGDGTSKVKWRILDSTASPPRPIAGAMILATYHRQVALPGFQDTICIGVDLATSDADGWFELRESSIMPEIAAHKTGYAQPFDRPANHAKERWVLLVPNAGYEQRIEHFRLLYLDTLCNYQDTRQMVVFLDAVIPELREIASTSRASEILRNMELQRDQLRRSN